MKERHESGEIRATIRLLLDPGRRFPQNVFLGTWSGHFFFDSDWMFSAEFVPWVKLLLQAERATYACVFDVDAEPGVDVPQPSSFAITSETSGAEFQAFLHGPDVGTGWLHTADRFACTSDNAGWCLYCERRNEMAVVAIRSERLRELVTEVRARPIEQAIAMPLSYGFSPAALSPEWRAELLKAYG